MEIYGNVCACIGSSSADGRPGCTLIPYGAYAITVKSGLKEGARAFLRLHFIVYGHECV